MKETKIRWLTDFYQWEDENEYFSKRDKDGNLTQKTLENYVVINNSMSLLKIDPLIASEYFYVAKNIDFFSFRLYQCDRPSKIRQNIPIRFFYSNKYGKIFELKGNNIALYDMIAFLLNYENKMKTLNSLWSKDRAWDYVRLFFDNVVGKHGRFEIVENYEQLYNRIKNFYRLSSYNFSFYHPSVLLFQKLIFKKFTNYSISFEFENDYIKFKNVLMLFKDGLFESDIYLGTVESNFGIISLKNEKLISYETLVAKKIDNDVSQITPIEEYYLVDKVVN